MGSCRTSRAGPRGGWRCRFPDGSVRCRDGVASAVGGSVLSTRCSETFETKTALISLFGIPLWYFSQSPRVAIQVSEAAGVLSVLPARRCAAWAVSSGSHGLCPPRGHSAGLLFLSSFCPSVCLPFFFKGRTRSIWRVPG